MAKRYADLGAMRDSIADAARALVAEEGLTNVVISVKITTATSRNQERELSIEVHEINADPTAMEGIDWRPN